MSLREILKKALKDQRISEKIYYNFLQFFETYTSSLAKHNIPIQEQEQLFTLLLEKVIEQIEEPYPFQPYHEKILHPFNYYQFGIDFVRSLIDEKRSKIYGRENLVKIQSQIERGENAIFFANHQTEIDPQILSLALEKEFPKLAEEVIFVAGDRVLSDPLAAPFSMGRNLLCIYSKRYIDHPPEKKHEKQLHNRKTMHRLKELLASGGRAIYVAPSGGRDRPDGAGIVQVAPFDPQSIEMFRLFTKEALVTSPQAKTHFYPLALWTYPILPPPPSIQKELGEVRNATRERFFLSFGKQIDMNHFPGHELEDRHAKRAACAAHIWELVHQDYLQITKSL